MHVEKKITRITRKLQNCPCDKHPKRLYNYTGTLKECMKKKQLTRTIILNYRTFLVTNILSGCTIKQEP